MVQLRSPVRLKPRPEPRSPRIPTASTSVSTPHVPSAACPVHPGRLAGFPLSQYRDVDPCRTVFFDAGQGEPVVFVHGLGGNLTHWQFVAPPLASTHRVAGLDLPGFGESRRMVGPPTYDRMADAVLSFMDRRSIARAVLVGHSFGGAVVTSIALSHPDRVHGLVLINPAGYSRLPWWMRHGGRVVLRPEVLIPGLFLSVLWILENVSRAETPEVDAFRRSATKLQGGLKFLDDLAYAASGMRTDLLERHFVDQLDALRLPVHMVWGGDDRLLSARAGAEAASLMPNCRFSELPGVGHMPIFERPAAVIEAIGDVEARVRQQLVQTALGRLGLAA